MRWILAAIVLAVVLYGATQARPHPMLCGDHAEAVATLKTKYNEDILAMGVTKNGQLVELLTSPSGSWTLVLVSPAGKACRLESGDGWQKAKEAEY